MKLIGTKEKVSNSKRIVAMVLFFAMVLSLTSSLTAFGIEEQPIMISPQFVGKPEEADIPFCLDEKVVSDAEHTVRLRYLETEDNVAAFSNPDGSATMYYFSNPIKYTDIYGNTVDIDNTLESIEEAKSQYKYKTTAAPATTYLPEAIGSGEDVKVEHNGHTIQIIPVSDKVSLGKTIASELKSGKSDGMIYNSVFGKGRSLKYTTLYNGVKEDIILDSYTQNANKFEFLIKTNGLELAEVNGQYLLRDSLGFPMFEMAPIFAYDSAEIPNMTDGTYTINEVKANEIYRVTVSVDDTWLSNATYPVTVDPTFKYSEDVGLEDSFQVTGNTLTTGSSNVLYVGNVNGKAARSFFRFPKLSLNQSTLKSLVSAKLYVKGKTVTTSNATSVISVEAYNIKREWTESDLPYSLPFDEYYSSPKGTGTVNLNNYGAIDITSLVTDWLTTSQASSASKGLILKVSSTNESGSSNYYAYIHSSEATSASDRPYLSIDYSYYPMPSTQNSNIRENRFYWAMDSSLNYAISFDTSTKMASKNYTDLSQRLLFTYESNGRYRISTENNPSGNFLSFNGSALSLESKSSSLNQQWYIAEISTGKYCIMNASSPDYSLNIRPSSLGYILYCSTDSPYLWSFEKCPTFYSQHVSKINNFQYWNASSENSSFKLSSFRFKWTYSGADKYSNYFYLGEDVSGDMMDSGCVMASFAMVFDNLNKKSVGTYDDPRTSSTTKTNLIPDPFTVTWANNGWNTISSNVSISSTKDGKSSANAPVVAEYKPLFQSFMNKDPSNYKYDFGNISYVDKAKKLKTALEAHPEGVLVRIGNDVHTIVVTKYIGPDTISSTATEKTVLGYFVVYDPASRTTGDGSGCLWIDCKSYDYAQRGISTADYYIIVS